LLRKPPNILTSRSRSGRRTSIASG
jgi:hypothetical protein